MENQMKCMPLLCSSWPSKSETTENYLLLFQSIVRSILCFSNLHMKYSKTFNYVIWLKKKLLNCTKPNQNIFKSNKKQQIDLLM